MNAIDGAPNPLGIRLDYAKPTDDLAPFVFGYHLYSVTTADGGIHEDIGYPSWANVRFQTSGDAVFVKIGNRLFDPMPRVALFGPGSRAVRVGAARATVVGFGLTPRGWTRLFGGDADRHADRITPLPAMVKDDAALLAQRLEGVEDIVTAATLFDRFLLRHMGTPHRAEDLVAPLQDMLADPENCSVSALAEQLGVEPRRLARLSRAHFGFTPKLLLRRARFLRTLLRLMEDDGRPHVQKIDRSYHDQSHFVRDCKFFLSMSPRRFIAMQRPLNLESARRRQQVLGAAVQALHRPGTVPSSG